MIVWILTILVTAGSIQSVKMEYPTEAMCRHTGATIEASLKESGFQNVSWSCKEAVSL